MNLSRLFLLSFGSSAVILTVEAQGKCTIGCIADELQRGWCTKKTGCEGCPIAETCEKLCRRCDGRAQFFGGLDCGPICRGEPPVTAPPTRFPTLSPNAVPSSINPTTNPPTSPPVEAPVKKLCWQVCKADITPNRFFCTYDNACAGCSKAAVCPRLCSHCEGTPDNQYGGLDCDCPGEPTIEPTIQPNDAPTAEPTVEPTIGPTVGPTAEPTVMGSTARPTRDSSIVQNPPIFVNPTSEPSVSPGEGTCECLTNSDCQNPVCVDIDPSSGLGQCGTNDRVGPLVSPSALPTMQPTAGPTAEPDCCAEVRSIPNECELDVLIGMMDAAVASTHSFAAQWLRASFHDAGTFNQETGEGGANGCLMNFPPMLDTATAKENSFLDIPVNTLRSIKTDWEARNETCVSVSSADMVQFGGFFGAIRQEDPPGLTDSKIATLRTFEWGRPDLPEDSCSVAWTRNLPGFDPSRSDKDDTPLRCLNTGGEIKRKMMDLNGFTAREATVLIGAHGMGHTRFTFVGSTTPNPAFNSPWTELGADDATDDGPSFTNSFFQFLDEIPATTADMFGADFTPFQDNLNSWFRVRPPVTAIPLNFLDTDVALAFPSQNTSIHPSFHTFTKEYAESPSLFLNDFFEAFEKMSTLGVTATLSLPFPCPTGACGAALFGRASQTFDFLGFLRNLGQAAAAGQAAVDAKQILREDEIVRATIVVEINDPNRIIDGEVLRDTDDDGIGDESLASVIVILLDSIGDVIATSLTDEEGKFEFTGLDPDQLGDTFTVTLENAPTPAPTPLPTSLPTTNGDLTPSPTLASNTPLPTIAEAPAPTTPALGDEAEVNLSDSVRKTVSLVV